MKRLSIEWKVGIFLVLSLICIIAGFAYLANKKGLFERGHTFVLNSRTGDGLTVGMTLNFSGFKIGKITELELSPEGLVMVKISVPTRHVKWLRKDSSFVLERPILGSTKLSVVTTNMSSPPLDPESHPMITEVSDINETIKRLEPVLEKVSSILSNVETITGTMAEKKSLLEMAISDQEAIEAVHETLKNTRQITADASSLLMRTGEELYGPEGIKPEVVNVLREVVINLRKTEVVMDNIIKVSANAARSTKDLEMLRKDIDRAVYSINVLIDEVNRKIPFQSEKKVELP